MKGKTLRRTAFFAVFVLVAVVLLLETGERSAVTAKPDEEHLEPDVDPIRQRKPIDRILQWYDGLKLQIAGLSRQELMRYSAHTFRYPLENRLLQQNDYKSLDPDYTDMGIAPVLYKSTSGKTKTSKHSCTLQPAKYKVVEGTPIEVSFGCVRESTAMMTREFQGSFEYVEITDYGMFRLGTEAPLPKATIERVDAEARGSTRFIYRPQPEDFADFVFWAAFTFPEEPEPHRLTTTIQCSPAAPAVFTGWFRDEVREGSLLIHAEADVRKPGYFVIEANIGNHEGPIAVATAEVELVAGRQEVPLRFFGQIFHDLRAEGPYEVTKLRGHRRASIWNWDIVKKGTHEERLAYFEGLSEDLAGGRGPEYVPEHEWIPTYEGRFEASRYSLKDFADREYSGPDKDRYLSAEP